MILRNPQALYILRILEKFENSQKMHSFIPEMGANPVQISTYFNETVQARKSSYWLDITHVFSRHPQLQDRIKRFCKITNLDPVYMEWGTPV